MTDPLSPEDFSTVIASIYDCALDPGRWEQALTDIRGALNCQTAVLGLTDVRSGRTLISKNVGMEPYWLQQLEEKHGAEIQAATAAALAASSLDDPLVLSRFYPPSRQDVSPYVQQCLKPQGLVDVLQYVLIQMPTRFSVLGAARHEQQGLITERETRIGGLLLPHIRRAVTISNVLEVCTIERSRMAEALGALRCAVILTDARCTILHANPSAEKMFKDGGPLRSVAGILQAIAPGATAEMRTAVKIAAANEGRIGIAGLAIRLTASDAPPMFAHVLPMTGSELRNRIQPESVAAVFVGAPSGELEGSELMAAAYGLTPAETRVLANLLAGRSLAETAQALGIAATTAKTHLDKIFLKTGVSRQADLMRLVTHIVPPISTRR